MKLEQELRREIGRELDSKRTKPTKPTHMLELHIVPQQALGVEWALILE